jgi:Tfp pilus assembly protein PilF
MMKSKIMVLLALLAALAACSSTPAQIQAQREKDPQYQYEKAVVCMQYGIPDEAFKYLNQALALDPRHSLSHNLLGLAYMIKGNLAEAVKAFRACIAVAPATFSEVYNNLGTALQESNQIGDAEAAFKKAFEMRGAVTPYLVAFHRHSRPAGARPSARGRERRALCFEPPPFPAGRHEARRFPRANVFPCR